jgi:hypothetical protein
LVLQSAPLKDDFEQRLKAKAKKST